MRDGSLIRIGGISALAVAATQVAGNALHPPLPAGAVETMQVINQASGWIPIHLVITVSYFLFVPFAIGAVPAFREGSGLVRIAVPLVLIGAALGVAQILTHYTIFNGLAATFSGIADPGLQASVREVFAALWSYSVGLEIAHLLAIFVAVSIFGIAMLRETSFPRWIALLGVAAGVIGSAGILIGKFVITGRTGDLVFGFGLVPLLVWIVAVAVVLLRLRPVTVPASVPLAAAAPK